MMILADVSSGRSDLASASPDERRHARVGRGRDRLDRRRAALAGRREGCGAHGDDDLRIGRFHRLDRVAGVDRPLERLGAEDLGDVGNLHDVEQRRHARRDVLRVGGRGRDDRVVAAGERDDQRRERLGEAMRVESDRRRRAPSRRRRAWPPPRRPRATLSPATSTSTGAPELQRGGQRARRHVAQSPARDLGQKKGRHVQITPASSCSLATSSATDLTFTPALRPLGSAVFNTLSRGATSTPKVGRRLLVDRLLLRLHDVGQGGVARLVEAQVRGDDRRQLQFHGLHAAVDFARHVDLAVADDDLGGERALAPAGQRGQHLTGLVAVVVDRLLADDDEARLLGRDDALQQLGDRERLGQRVGLDEDAAVGAHGERGPDGLAGLGRADRDDDDFARLAGFLLAQRLLDRDLVERVHRHLDVGEFDARPIGLDANLDVVVDHPFHGHKDLHGPQNSSRTQAFA